MAIVNNVRNADGSTPARIPARAPRHRAAGRGGYGNLNSGGLVNPGTGLGTSLDKGEGNIFVPTRIYWRTPLEILGVQSWVARNALTIPNFDMFLRWREHNGDDESAVAAMKEGEQTAKVETALYNALVAADQYGTGIVAMMTNEDAPDTPLVPERIREGDLAALQWFDRYDISVSPDGRSRDLWDPQFGDPIFYDLHPSHGGVPIRMHHSRILRFDGIRPPTKSGFSSYDQDFGVSVLVPILTSIMQDSAGASAIAHLMQEASIKVLNIAGLRETVAGGGDPNEVTPDEIGAQILNRMSIYRLLMLDEPGREDFQQKGMGTTFGGLAEIMDMFEARVAAARQIPRTRFLGSPPIGMSATGESDMKNYVMMVEANRARLLRDPLKQLDIVLSRHIGLKEPLEFEYRSLLELSDQEVAEAFKVKAEGWKILVETYAADEDEMREAFNGDPATGELPGPAPEAPEEPDPIELIEATAKAKAGASANGNGRSHTLA